MQRFLTDKARWIPADPLQLQLFLQGIALGMVVALVAISSVVARAAI